jgi:hypothetical protein
MMDMTSAEFSQLLRNELETAVVKTEQRLQLRIPRAVLIELHGAGSAGSRCSVDEAAKRLFLGSEKFFKVIDIAVKAVTEIETVIFVRVSGHKPVIWAATWNPSGSGPFKQIEAERIELSQNE